MKKFLAVLLVISMFTMLFASGTTVSAEEPYEVTYSSEVNLSPEYIKELAVQQNSVDTAKNEYRAVQLAEVREYNDGSLEKDYTMSTLTSGTSSTSNYGTNSPFQMTVTMHFTYRQSGSVYEYRLNRVVTTINKTTQSTVSVTSAMHCYRLSSSVYREATISYNNSTIPGTQSFTLYSAHSGYYTCENDPLAASKYGIMTEGSIDLSNGSWITVQVMPYV